MKRVPLFQILFLCLMNIMLWANFSYGQDTGYVVQPYFGLAVAYPDSVGPFEIERQPKNNPGRQPVGAVLTIDKKGKVKQIDYAPDSTSYFKPIEKKIKKIRFNFNPGLEIGWPQKIPVTIQYRAQGREAFGGQLTFPIGHSLKPDTILLREYFKLNDISPPRVRSLRPVFHKPRGDSTQNGYLVVKLVVKLDARGKMIDLIYPNAAEKIAHHYVHTALMDAEFETAVIKGQAVPCDLPLIFRLFDNLKYPFSPTVSADTTDPRPITEAFFMTPDYNPADRSMIPLPRKHPYKYIESAPLGRKILGEFQLNIGIDSSGRVGAISLPRTPADKAKIVRRAIKLIRWYPALDYNGQARRFSGRIQLQFDGSSHIVYIPEWLAP